MARMARGKKGKLPLAMSEIRENLGRGPCQGPHWQRLAPSRKRRVLKTCQRFTKKREITSIDFMDLKLLYSKLSDFKPLSLKLLERQLSQNGRLAVLTNLSYRKEPHFF